MSKLPFVRCAANGSSPLPAVGAPPHAASCTDASEAQKAPFAKSRPANPTYGVSGPNLQSERNTPNDCSHCKASIKFELPSSEPKFNFNQIKIGADTVFAKLRCFSFDNVTDRM